MDEHDNLDEEYKEEEEWYTVQDEVTERIWKENWPTRDLSTHQSTRVEIKKKSSAPVCHEANQK